MTAPNLLNVTTITGKTSRLNLTTSAQSLVSNASSSGKVLKIESLYVTNIDASNTRTLTLGHYDQAAAAGTAVSIANTLSIAPSTTITLITKDCPIYLEEDTSLGALASANSSLVIVVSYEEIS